MTTFLHILQERTIALKGGPTTLIDACVRSICQNIHRFESFDGIPDELIQEIFSTLAANRQLNYSHLELLYDGVWEVLLPSYPALNNDWLIKLGTNFRSLARLDVRGCTDVTDAGIKSIAALPHVGCFPL